MIFLYLKLIKAAAAACSGLFLVSEPAPDSYNLMNLYPEEISTEAAAANAAEKLIKENVAYDILVKELPYEQLERIMRVLISKYCSSQTHIR